MSEINVIDNGEGKCGKELRSRFGWLTERMMNDEWYFGLVDIQGRVWCVTSINSVGDTGWADVNFMEQEDAKSMIGHWSLVGSPTDQTSGSLNLNNIVAAFEIANT